jgi:hypothetical protein
VTGHGARMGENSNAYMVLWGNLKAKLDLSEDLCADWRIILKRVFLEIESHGVNCLHLAQIRDKSKRS